MKIVIIGYSGSGKSTLAENLARYYSIPKLHKKVGISIPTLKCRQTILK